MIIYLEYSYFVSFITNSYKSLFFTFFFLLLVFRKVFLFNLDEYEINFFMVFLLNLGVEIEG